MVEYDLKNCIHAQLTAGTFFFLPRARRPAFSKFTDVHTGRDHSGPKSRWKFFFYLFARLCPGSVTCSRVFNQLYPTRPKISTVFRRTKPMNNSTTSLSDYLSRPVAAPRSWLWCSGNRSRYRSGRSRL